MRKDSVGTCPKKFSLLKIFGYGAIYKKVPFFTDFCVLKQKKMPKIDTLDALEEHEEHDDDYQTITNWNANW